MNPNGETVVLFSGGIDSSACAHYLQTRGHAVRGLFVDYGQKAAKNEKAAAERLSISLGMKFSVLNVKMDRCFGAGEIRGRNAFLVFSSLLGSGCEGAAR